jgi:hypothetical protein
VGTLIFAVVGMLMLLAPDGGWSLRILGGVTVGFFGVLGIPSLARQLLEAGSPVVIDAEGIHVPRGFDLPWHEMRSVGVFNVRGARTVSLGVGHAYLQRWLTGRSPFMRLLTGANRALVGEDAFSLPSTLKADADTLAHWIGEETARREAGAGL